MVPIKNTEQKCDKTIGYHISEPTQSYYSFLICHVENDIRRNFKSIRSTSWAVPNCMWSRTGCVLVLNLVNTNSHVPDGATCLKLRNSF